MFDNPPAKRYSSTLTMATGDSVSPCEFDKLFTRSVPHIIENIFFSLDYDSFMNCGKVCVAWKDLFSSKLYQQEAVKLWQEKKENELRLCQYSKDGDVEEVQRLLASGVEPNCATDTPMINLYGDNPLCLAATSGNNEVMKLLLKFGADPNRENGFKESPLRCAARAGHYELVKQLVNVKAKPDKVYVDKALYMAAIYGHTNTVELLLDRGADPNSKTRYGTLSLTVAARNGYKNVVKLLLEKGVDPETVDFWEETPLNQAERNGHMTIAKMIKEKIIDNQKYRDRQKCSYVV